MPSNIFSLILLGDALANFGSWLDFLAVLSMSAYKFKSSTYGMAGLSCALLLPGIICARWIGRLSDRVNPARILSISIPLRVIGTISILMSSNYWTFVLFVAAHSLASAFVVPAINTFTTHISAERDLTRRFSLLTAVNNFCKILAPSIGAAASQWFGEASVLLVSAALTGLGGLCFVAMRINHPQENAFPKSSKRIAGNSVNVRTVIPFLCVVAAYSTLGMLVNNQMPLILRNLGFGKEILGFLVSSAGIGGLLGAAFLAKKTGNQPRYEGFIAIVIPSFASCAVFVCIGLLFRNEWIYRAPLLCLCFFMTGLLGSFFAVNSNVYLAKRYPASVGETTAIRQGTQSVVQLLSPFVGAFLIQRFTYSSVFIFDGFGIALFIACLTFCKLYARTNRFSFTRESNT